MPRQIASAIFATFLALPHLTCAALPPALEARLSEIYDKHAYDTKRFSGAWLSQANSYLVAEPITNGKGSVLAEYTAPSGERQVLLSAAQLTPVGAAAPIAVEGFVPSKDGNRLLICTNVRPDPLGVELADLWLFDRDGGALRKVVEGAEGVTLAEVLSPDGTRALYVRKRNLFVQHLATGAVSQLTTDGVAARIGNGVSEWGPAIARWSPDGKRIAYIQADVSQLGQFPLINYTEAVYPEVKYQRFPAVGTTITALRVGIVDAKGSPTQWVVLPSEPAGYYIDEIDWAPDSETLIIQKLSRGRDVVEIFAASANTNAVTRIHREEDRAWLRDSGLANDSGFEWIRGGKAFTWLSERDGWRRAYVLSRDGKQQSALTPTGVDVISLVDVDDHGGWLYYRASPDNPTQRYLYRARMDGRGRPERLTPGQPGTHDYELSPDARWAIHIYSDADTPPIVDLIELPRHRVVRVLEDNAASRTNLAAWNPRPTEFFRLDIGEGVTIDAWMLKPRDFDPAKKYPVFVYVYSEPYQQTVLDRWSLNHQLFHRAIADAGYLVVSMDSRGTPAPRGSAWRRQVFGSLGPLSTEEQAAGLRELARTRPYVDPARVGIWGWSAGGTNTLNALFRKPDQYHVGIAVVPKPRPELYNAWFQEIYMRTPQENPKGYRLAAPINYADGLKGNLLMITGSGETNTHVQIIDHLVNRLVELGKPFDYMIYPNRDHSMREGAETRPHLYRLIARYLTDHLPAGQRDP